MGCEKRCVYCFTRSNVSFSHLWCCSIEYAHTSHSHGYYKRMLKSLTSDLASRGILYDDLLRISQDNNHAHYSDVFALSVVDTRIKMLGTRYCYYVIVSLVSSINNYIYADKYIYTNSFIYSSNKHNQAFFRM